MKTRLMPAFLAVALMASCAGNKGSVDNDSASVNDIDSKAPVELNGQWNIENIFFNDSDYVRPTEILPDFRQYVQFTDSTYFIMTNCNSISGYYTLSGDSITLGDGMMTEMACDDMQTEDALRRILPDIATIDVENDSIVRLNSRNNTGYLILKKNSAYEVK